MSKHPRKAVPSNNVINDLHERIGMAKHLRTDRDGNIVISKNALLLIGTIVAILGFITGLMGQVLAANADFANIKQDVQECKAKSATIDQNNKDIAVLKESIVSIKESQKRIETKLDQVISG